MTDNTFSFSFYCPLCNERLEAEGRTSKVVSERKVEHMVDDHDTEYLLKRFLARKIVEKN